MDEPLGEEFFKRGRDESVSQFASRMLELIQHAKTLVQIEAGNTVDIQEALDEVQEIIDGNGKSLAVRGVRKELDFARKYFPQLDIPAYPSDVETIEAALRLLKANEGGKRSIEIGDPTDEEEAELISKVKVPEDMDWEPEEEHGNNPRVVRVQGIMSGDPTIEGTRVRPESILLEVLTGASAKSIHETYPSLPEGSVRAAIDWGIGRLQYARRRLSGSLREWDDNDFTISFPLRPGDEDLPRGAIKFKYPLLEVLSRLRGVTAGELDEVVPGAWSILADWVAAQWAGGASSDLADVIVADTDRWDRMLKTPLNIRLEGLPKEVLERLREIEPLHRRVKFEWIDG